MKTGEDFARLENRFKALMNQHATRSLDASQSPIKRLRDMIPYGNADDPVVLDGSSCDPMLVLREEDRQSWDRHIAQAASAMSGFNRELVKAINLDKEITSCKHPLMSVRMRSLTFP